MKDVDAVDAFAAGKKTIKNKWRLLVEQFFSGIIMAWTSYLIIRTFEMRLFGWGGVVALFLLFMLITYVYVPSGFPAVAVLAVIVLVFAYLWSPASPYGSTIRESVSFITEPLGKMIDLAKDGFHDLWLMMTDPNRYIREKMYGNVEPEKPGYIAQGVEITQADARPSLIRHADQNFKIYARVENSGGQTASNVHIIASCEEGEQCKRISGGTFDYSQESMSIKSTKSYTFGPFRVMKEYERSWKEYSSVVLKAAYEYETRTALDIELMSSEEVGRLAAGENIYYSKSSTVDETMPPAALSLNIVDQPIEGGTTDVLIVSVVNRGEGHVAVDGKPITLNLPEITHKYECRGEGVIRHEKEGYVKCEPGEPCEITFSLSGATAQAVYENPENTETYINFLCEFGAKEPGNVSKTFVATANFTFGYEIKEEAKVSIMEDLFETEMEGDATLNCSDQGGVICDNCMYEPIDSSDGGTGGNAKCCPQGACEDIYCRNATLAKIIAAAGTEWPGPEPGEEDNRCCRIDVRNMDGEIEIKEIKTELEENLEGFDPSLDIYHWVGGGKVEKGDDFIWINYRTESVLGTGVGKFGRIELCEDDQKRSCNCGFWSPNVKSEVECETADITPSEYCAYYCCLCNPEEDESGDVYCAPDIQKCEEECGETGVYSFGIRSCEGKSDCNAVEPYFCCTCGDEGVGYCVEDREECTESCRGKGGVYDFEDYNRCSADGDCPGRQPASETSTQICGENENVYLCCGTEANQYENVRWVQNTQGECTGETYSVHVEVSYCGQYADDGSCTEMCQNIEDKDGRIVGTSYCCC